MSLDNVHTSHSPEPFARESTSSMVISFPSQFLQSFQSASRPLPVCILSLDSKIFLAHSGYLTSQDTFPLLSVSRAWFGLFYGTCDLLLVSPLHQGSRKEEIHDKLFWTKCWDCEKDVVNTTYSILGLEDHTGRPGLSNLVRWTFQRLNGATACFSKSRGTSEMLLVDTHPTWYASIERKK